MRATGGLVTVDPDGAWPRLLPFDRRVRRSVAEVREQLDRVQLDLERYAATWMGDPPNPEEIHHAAAELVDAARSL
ncbi:MAG TPA: hypothetical protein VJQ43_03925, partial [Thermoplasmata archaeon]|nr:hypothetical protein [Thermoplasmata archaeon]